MQELQDVVIVPITLGVVEGIKKIDSEKKLERFYWLFSLGIATGLSFLFSYYKEELSVQALFFGVIWGLSASGLYSGGKSMLEKNG